MKKKAYNVCGFDCASCASKAETHIAKQEDVESAHISFASNKAYITFKNDPWSVGKLASVIKEVESDPLEISEVGEEIKEEPLFNRKMVCQLLRASVSIILTLVCIFALGRENLTWVRFGIYVSLIILIGYDIFYKVFAHIKNRTNILDHNFLIFLASVGSLTLAIISLAKGDNNLVKLNNNYFIALDDAMEAVLVMSLFQIGSVIESYASNKSKKAIVNAINLRVEKANLIKDDQVVVVKPEELAINDKIIVTTGELIPIDGIIIEGNGIIDTSSLTGEYVPVTAGINEEVYAGCLLKSGSIKVLVKKTYENSSVNKIINLITNSEEKKSRADKFVDRFAKWYTPVIVIVAFLTFILGALISNNWMMWTHTGLEVLVIGCPCAIVISVPLAYFSGLGLASKNGVVIKGSNYLDALSSLSKVVSDKTGTLTQGIFKITKVHAVNGDAKELLNSLYAVESLSNHPIAKAITHDVDVKELASKQTNFLEEAGLGCSSVYQGHHLYAGNEKLLNKYGIKVEKVNETGTVIYVGKDKEYLGYVLLDDVIKENAYYFISYLHKQNIKSILLTGDNEVNAMNISNKLGLDKYYANLLPEDKTNILEKEMENNKGYVAFIGDGINDAPSIERSDIGVAMGAIGSDVAIENADVVIMNDDPSKLISAIKISKKTRRTAIFNIVFALVVKAVVLVLAIIFPSWTYMMYIAVFADTGLTILLTINSLLLLKRKVR